MRRPRPGRDLISVPSPSSILFSRVRRSLPDRPFAILHPQSSILASVTILAVGAFGFSISTSLGNPVIVRIRFRSGATHFVVIAGKQGFDYLIRDPGAGASKGYYPLRNLGSNIEALRFYEPLSKPRPALAVQR